MRLARDKGRHGLEFAACVQVPRGSEDDCRQGPRLSASALHMGCAEQGVEFGWSGVLSGILIITRGS